MTEATVRALVVPFGLSTECAVEYVDEAAFKSDRVLGSERRSPAREAVLPASFGPKPVAAQLPGLQVGHDLPLPLRRDQPAGQSVTAQKRRSRPPASATSQRRRSIEEGQPVTQAGRAPVQVRHELRVQCRNGRHREPCYDANPKTISVANCRRA